MLIKAMLTCLSVWSILLVTNSFAQSTAKLSISEIVQENLTKFDKPTSQLMLADDAAKATLRQMKNVTGRKRTPYLRLLRWIGDDVAIPELLAIKDDAAMDRYEWTRTLVALDAYPLRNESQNLKQPDVEEIERLVLELFQDDPVFGSPLLRCYPSEKATQLARNILNPRKPRYARYAAWVLGNSQDIAQVEPLQQALLYVQHDESAEAEKIRNSINIAIRRLELEQRDVRAEALWEYLEDIQDQPSREDELLWCLRELATTNSSDILLKLRTAYWRKRALKPGLAPATILWTRYQLGDSLTKPERHQLQIQRYHLSWIRGGSAWPPKRRWKQD